MTGPRVDIAPADAISVAPPVGFVPGSIQEARKQMALYGITQEQRTKGYTGRVSEALYDKVKPVGYTGHGMQLVDAIGQIVNPVTPDRSNDNAIGQNAWGFNHPKRRGDDVDPGAGGFTGPEREDSWRLYLGLPQVHDTFGISPFQPANSTEKKVYFSYNNADRMLPGTIEGLVDKAAAKPNKSTVEYDFNGALGHYKLSLGQDEAGHYLSYYDKWDLDKTGANVVGHPYEIYNRIYYDPKTFERIPEQEVLAKKAGADLKPEDHDWIKFVLGKK